MHEKMISRDAGDDPIHAALKAAVEVPTRTHLWVPEDAIEFTPPLCNTVFGDGRALLEIAPMNTRPMYYAVRIDSGWKVDDLMAPTDAPDLRDFIDDIYDALEAQFGDAGPHEDDDGNEYFDEWPAFDASAGTSWCRLNWPDGVGATESHPFARSRKILKVPTQHHFTGTLPRGCIASDRYGKPFLVWPDGSYGYDKASRCPRHLGAYNFGPYTVLREGLTEEQCDAFAEGERCGTDPIAEAGAA